MGTFGKSDRFRTTKNGTSSGQIEILRPLRFNQVFVLRDTLYLYSSKNPYFYEYHFVINVGRKKNNDRNNNNKKDANGLGDIISIHRTFSEENTFLYLSHSAYKILLQCHTKISWSCQALLPYERKGEIEDCDNGHFSNCDISAIPNWTDEMWGRLITFSLCVWL